MPLAVADPAWDVGGHRGLRLTWVTKEEGMKEEESGWMLEKNEKSKNKCVCKNSLGGL